VGRICPHDSTLEKRETRVFSPLSKIQRFDYVRPVDSMLSTHKRIGDILHGRAAAVEWQSTIARQEIAIPGSHPMTCCIRDPDGAIGDELKKRWFSASGAPPLAKISICSPRNALSRKMERSRELFSLIQLEGAGRAKVKEGWEKDDAAGGDKSPPLACNRSSLAPARTFPSA